MNENLPDQGNGKTTTPSATAVYDKFFSNLETLSGIAEKGASHSLLTIGMGVITIALLTKIKFQNYSFFYLEPSEFIAFIIVGFFLMIAAAIMRLYTFKVQMELEKERNKLGADLLRESQEAAQDLIKEKKNIAKDTGI